LNIPLKYSLSKEAIFQKTFENSSQQLADLMNKLPVQSISDDFIDSAMLV
jgi:hypothetical protein